MRIIAGKWRGRRLAAVGKGDAAAQLRPTADRVRESLFNVLSSGSFGDPITEARVLDLFAGTGALGLEALSRGASHATFVDQGNAALTLLRQNIGLCGAEGETTVQRCDARRLPGNPDAAFGLVFLDPPYGRGLGEKALDSALAGRWLAPDALILFEENRPVSPDGFEVLDNRRYGDTHVTLLRPAP